MNHIILQHAKLGSLKCLHDTSTFMVKILGLPYGTISQRFARSQPCLDLTSHRTRYNNNTFDATFPGPSSIQPFGSVTSDASNIPLPTENLSNDEDQSEDCLNLSIHLPASALTTDLSSPSRSAKLPVVVFLHGGAYFLGSANRPYYSPVDFVAHAISQDKPVIFVSLNYRLGALGFWHAQTRDAGLVPPNNGLHDQMLALQWVQTHIAGFGGDATNVTALGQSAGAESISVLSNAGGVEEMALFKRAVMLSGSPVTMPAMTPAEHTANFVSQAARLGVNTKDRDVDAIAQDVLHVDVSAIRDLAWVGSPCCQSSLFPFDKPTMAMMRQGGPEAWQGGKGIEAQIVGTTTYDGGISFNMMARDESRKDHAKAFVHIARDVLGPSHGSELCSIYGVEEGQDDADALQRICFFESDIGFFFGALAVASANIIPDTYFQIFDLPNPFEGPIRERGEYATHTFDIATLLGGYDHTLLPGSYEPVIASWRDRILDFIRYGKGPCERYIDDGKALVVEGVGVREVRREEYMEGRRERLMELANRVDSADGWDVLWVDVCRRFLMKGE